MAKEIGVFVGGNGATASFFERGTLAVYQKKQGQWGVLREQEFTLADSLSLRELRARMNQVLKFLGSCKVFVGLSVVGVPYFELEKANCSIWEVHGQPEGFLEEILAQEEDKGQEYATDCQTAQKIAPQEISAGWYRLSLKDIQNNNLGITSKQALLPFLRKGEFYQIQVICDHLPPWLEAEFINLNLAGTTRSLGREGLEVTITKKLCDC